MKIIWLGLTMILILSDCKSNNIKETSKNKKRDLEAEMQILDTYNTENYLVIGTPTYDSIKTNMNLLEFSIVNQYEKMLENSIMDDSFDTIEFQKCENGIEIIKSVYTRGSCLEFIPYSYKNGDTLKVKCPDTGIMYFSIENNDTVAQSESCTLEAYSDVIIKLDSSLYNGLKIIEFEDECFFLNNSSK